MEYASLKELIAADLRSCQLFASFPPDKQVELMEQRQNIHTYDDLHRAAGGMQKQSAGWQET